MTKRPIALAALAFSAIAAPAQSRTTIDIGDAAGGSAELSPYLQCVPYARQLTGIQIYGDAHTWWGQAEGRYARGRTPRAGAVMAVQPHGNSRLGHVAAVRRVLDSRTLLISHANWSVPGKIEENVRAVDVSPANDWSEVRIWYGPSQSLGTSHWPLYGFIYNDKPGGRRNTAPARHQRTPDRIARRNDPVGDIIAASLR
ncbi:MAG: CHAP domain-containing protein [Novosphingobium sp.]|nr:CHAP domain-containing protein [Novosphingobium sp.]MCP5401224.1 CHAP domain-containing protein [Novosphingobium sp.]